METEMNDKRYWIVDSSYGAVIAGEGQMTLGRKENKLNDIIMSGDGSWNWDVYNGEERLDMLLKRIQEAFPGVPDKEIVLYIEHCCNDASYSCRRTHLRVKRVTAPAEG